MVVHNFLFETYNVYEHKYGNTTHTLKPWISSKGLSKGKLYLWSIMRKGKQLVGSSSSYNEFYNYISIEQFDEIMNQSETFDILA